MTTITHINITPKGATRGSYGNYNVRLMNGNELITHANTTATKSIDDGNHLLLAKEVLKSNDINIEDYDLSALQERDEE